VDQHGLVLQPLRPAVLTDLGLSPAAEVVVEWGVRQARCCVAAAGAGDIGHGISRKRISGVRERYGSVQRPYRERPYRERLRTTVRGRRPPADTALAGNRSLLP